MVTKKYLCAAPRQESWDSKAEALLKSLNGDKAKREQIARQTLDMLKERHKHEKKRAGPGRKSNAEHAIAFYEYLVDGASGRRNYDDDESGSNMNDTNTSGNDDDDQTIDTQEFLNQHDNICDVCNLGGELICCSTCTLVFHQECIRPVLKSIPPDWICPYCITQGVNSFKRHSKTWRAAASGIRQMNRLKMEQQEEGGEATGRLEEQSDSDEKSEDEIKEDEDKKEDTPKSKNKSRDVESSTNDDNEVKKGRNKIKSESSNSKKRNSAIDEASSHKKQLDHFIDKSNASAAAGRAVKSASTASSVTSSNGGESRRKNLALFKIADSYTPDCTESLLVRGRRQRKQPSLYRPQMCADSRWRSDEKDVRGNNTENSDSDDTNSRSSDDGSETDTKSNTKGGSKAHKGKQDQMEDNIIICVGGDSERKREGDGPFCNFCSDDEAIPICVFCGCRVCFGKHDKPNLLLCDSCDDEYHTSCLGLTTVPLAQKWYCPSCEKAKVRDSTRSTTSNLRLHGTRRASKILGTPPNSSDAMESSSKRSSPGKKNRSSAASTTAKTPTPLDSAAKRGRGRPPKITVETETAPVHSLSPRKRVRTPKAAANSTEPMEQEYNEHRKRGRPSKSTSKSTTSTDPDPADLGPSSGRKRGRPPKSTAIPTSSSSKTKTTPTPSPRKRGRPPKSTPEPEIVVNVESEGKKKPPKPTTPTPSVLSTASSKTGGASTASESTAKPVKVVSRVSGRTVKRASFHDELDEGEQHLRSSKTSSSGDISQLGSAAKANGSSGSSSTPKTVLSKPEEFSEMESTPSEPVRKKQKVVEEKSCQSSKATAVTAPSTANSIEPSTKGIRKQTPVALATSQENDKDEEMLDLPPVAPVRMKPVLEPPAAVTAVRMKPVLEPPAPSLRPPIEAPIEDPKPEKVEAETPTVVTTKENASSTATPTETETPVVNGPAGETLTASIATIKAEDTDDDKKTKSELPKSSNPSTTNTAATATTSTAASVPKPPASTSNTSQASSAPPEKVQPPTVGTNTTRLTPVTAGLPNYPSTPLLDPVALEAAIKALPDPITKAPKPGTIKQPRRKPGARECMQISRRFGVHIIPEKYMKTLLDYCKRGKVEHLIKMRERLDCHSRYLESQLAGLEALVEQVGDSKAVVPALPHPNHQKRDSANKHGRSPAGRTTPPLSSGAVSKRPSPTTKTARPPALGSAAAAAAAAKATQPVKTVAKPVVAAVAAATTAPAATPRPAVTAAAPSTSTKTA